MQRGRKLISDAWMMPQRILSKLSPNSERIRRSMKEDGRRIDELRLSAQWLT